MNRRMVWIENDHFSGWSCSQCNWAISAIRLDTTIAVLRFNSFAEEGFQRHECGALVATKSGCEFQFLSGEFRVELQKHSAGDAEI